MARRPNFERPRQGFDPIVTEPIVRRQPRPGIVGPLIDYDRDPADGPVLEATRMPGLMVGPSPGGNIIRDVSEQYPCVAGGPLVPADRMH